MTATNIRQTPARGSAEAKAARTRGAAKKAAEALEEYTPSYRAAGIAALAVFALYFITIAPSTAMWDTGEYMAAAKVLGLPHPPGNPFFVLLANVLDRKSTRLNSSHGYISYAV